jgi:hypothetical protein
MINDNINSKSVIIKVKNKYMKYTTERGLNEEREINI